LGKYNCNKLKYLAVGGAAMTANMKMQFTNMPKEEKGCHNSWITSLLQTGYTGKG
jgi:hypothetical protein